MKSQTFVPGIVRNMYRAFKTQSIRHTLNLALVLQFIHSSCVANAQCDLWQPMGSSANYVTWLQKYNGELYAAGNICTFDPPICGVVKWSGTKWEMVGDYSGFAFVLTEFNGELIGGGMASTIVTGSVARWDGTAWHTLGPIMNGAVGALCVYNNQLYAAGDFTMAGNVPANGIARWDGTSWQAMGAGLTHSTNNDTDVNALAVYNNELIVGGYFTHANGIASPMLAKWDGTTWHAMPGAPSASVIGLNIYEGDLVACGSFQTIAGIQVNRIARWNGSGWSGFGDINHDNTVNVVDMLGVINTWGACPAPCSTDLNSDGTVNVADLLGVINAWGACL